MRKMDTDSLVATTYICNNYSSDISTQDGDYDSDERLDTERQFLRKDVPRVLDGEIQSLVAENKPNGNVVTTSPSPSFKTRYIRDLVGKLG